MQKKKKRSFALVEQALWVQTRVLLWGRLPFKWPAKKMIFWGGCYILSYFQVQFWAVTFVRRPDTWLHMNANVALLLLCVFNCFQHISHNNFISWYAKCVFSLLWSSATHKWPKTMNAALILMLSLVRCSMDGLSVSHAIKMDLSSLIKKTLM